MSRKFKVWTHTWTSDRCVSNKRLPSRHHHRKASRPSSLPVSCSHPSPILRYHGRRLCRPTGQQLDACATDSERAILEHSFLLNNGWRHRWNGALRGAGLPLEYIDEKPRKVVQTVRSSLVYHVGLLTAVLDLCGGTMAFPTRTTAPSMWRTRLLVGLVKRKKSPPRSSLSLSRDQSSRLNRVQTRCYDRDQVCGLSIFRLSSYMLD